MTINNEHNKLNVPNLRFPEFQGEWEEHKLEDITAEIGDGIHATPIYDDNGTFYFVNGNNISEYGITITATTQKVTEEEALRNNASALNSYSILLSINGTVGNVALYKNESIMLGKSACYINVSSNINRNYIFYYLMMPKCQFYFTSELTGTTIKNLSLKSIRKTKVLLPNANEQSKIARLFDAINERIATQNKIIEDLKKLKSAIIEKLYKEIQGTWYSYRQLFSIINERNKQLEYSNVLSASQERGMVSREDLNLDIHFERSNISTYKIVKNGDYVIHLRSFQGGFAFSEKTGICSPAYTVLRPHNLLVYGYLSNYFTSRDFVNSLIIVTYGIRDGRSINVDEWLDMKVVIPSKEQQTHIVNVIESIENKIKNEETYSNCLLNQKQYLLRQMFI